MSKALLRITIVTILLISFGLCGSSIAAPSISGVIGTVSNGSSITIAGSGFGSKPNGAAPLLYDTVDGTYSNITEGEVCPHGGANPWNVTGASVNYAALTSSNSVRTKRSQYNWVYTNYYNISKGTGSNGGTTGNATVGEHNFTQCASGVSGGGRIYISWWSYDHTSPNSNPGNSNKIIRLTDSSFYDDGVTVLVDPGSNGGQMYIYSNATGYDQKGNSYPNIWQSAGVWARNEVLVDNTASPNPVIDYWVNHALSYKDQAVTNLPGQITGIFTLGADWTNAQNNPIPQQDWGKYTLTVLPRGLR